MINNDEIMGILSRHAPVGVVLTVQQIRNIVEANYNLSVMDLSPQPCEVDRGSEYPRWHRRVQDVLFVLKKAQKIEHCGPKKYKFQPNSFVLGFQIRTLQNLLTI